MKMLLKILLVLISIILILVVVLVSEAFIARSGEVEAFTNPERKEMIFGSGERLNYAVLGDSTAAGQGGTYDKGIAISTAKYLAKTREVHMTNFAISGAVLKEVLEEQLPLALKLNPDVILISAGANDVTHLTSNSKIADNLTKIVKAIKDSNNDAKIVFTGAADMGSIPRFMQPLRTVAGIRSSMINNIFDKFINDKDIILAPIAKETGPVFRKDPTLFYNDRFHPNDKGYELWIETINKALDKVLP